MYQHRVSFAAGKGHDQHQYIVQAKASHVEITIQCTLTIAEILITDKQSTRHFINILDDILIAAVWQSVYNSISITRIKHSDTMSFFFIYNFQIRINHQTKQKLVLFYCSASKQLK